MILESINSPADLRALDAEQLDVLAEEMRQLIVESVNAHGGHLGSNLGVVELTLAMHRVFDSPATSSCGTPATRPTSTRSSPAGSAASTTCARPAACRATRRGPSPSTTGSRTATPRPS